MTFEIDLKFASYIACLFFGRDIEVQSALHPLVNPALNCAVFFHQVIHKAG